MIRQHVRTDGPQGELAATTNAAAFRFWLRASGRADLTDDAALRAFAAARQVEFHDAVAAFAGTTAAKLAPTLAAMLLDADLRPDDAEPETLHGIHP